MQSLIRPWHCSHGFAIFILIFSAAYSISLYRGTYQGALAAYLSAAKNISSQPGHVCINQKEVIKFHSLAGPEGTISREKLKYRFSSGDCTVSKDLQSRHIGYLPSVGYLMLIAAMMKLIPILGDLQVAIVLSSLAHAASSAWAIHLLPRGRSKVLFTLGYALNPLILWIAVFPYYYSLLPLAAVAFLQLYNRIYYSSPRSQWEPVALLGLIAAVCLARPTLMLVLIMSCVFVFRSGRVFKVQVRSFAAVMILACVLFALFSSSKPWHTAVVGLDAYHNPWTPLADERVTQAIERQNGMSTDELPLVLRIGTENYLNSAQIAFTNAVYADPVDFFRRATLNIAAAFGFGYINSSAFLAYFSVAVGVLISAWLYYRFNPGLVSVIPLSVLPFIFYMPPIPSYNLFNFLVLVFLIAAACGGAQLKNISGNKE